ncbi:MAG TPA: hypothetical protein VF665_06290 [Longimicrobium sp.]|jgi:hypothetical protein|uniref:hypothetical protein n=1 Tax=Longimicrobium sp. TaxID=2029185 RepID=UPI002EDB44DF
MSIKNKAAYQDAYQRALEGKSARSLGNLLTSLFEDHYTRESREQGARDGAAARGEAAPQPASGVPLG